jgi:virginiamycin A acetyltransferase
MILNCQINPKTVKGISTFIASFESVQNFPILNIGTDSYVVSSEIHTGINLGSDFVHNIQIGKYCSIGTNFTVLIDLTHDYKSITTSDALFMPGIENKIRRKGQIIIQNDVYIGHHVTIMAGATIGNGAVIGAESVVRKDIPPYAIAVGNPCQVVKYRFPEHIIKKLQIIRWWDFDEKELIENCELFQKDIHIFVDRFYQTSQDKQKLPNDIRPYKKEVTYLFCPDIEAPFSIWQKVLRSFHDKFAKNDNVSLLLFIKNNGNIINQTTTIKSFINGYSKIPDIIIYEDDFDERALFMKSDYFITTRDPNIVRWSTYADEFGTKIISGVDIPIFDP